MGKAFTAAAVQAAYVLMDREETTDKVVELIGEAAAAGRRARSCFPRSSCPARRSGSTRFPSGTATRQWFARLVDQAVVVPSPTTERIGAAAREAGAYVVVGVDEREPHGTTIYNTLLYFGPDGRLLNKHRKLMPTGSERTVWGMGDGSTLDVVPDRTGPPRRPHLLGELHAPGAVPPLRPGRARSGSRRPWRGVTAGSRRCATSPARAGSGSSGSTPACGSTRFPPTSPTATGSGEPSTVTRPSGSSRATA